MILRQAQDERRLCYSYLENQVPFPEPAHAEPVEAPALQQPNTPLHLTKNPNPLILSLSKDHAELVEAPALS